MHVFKGQTFAQAYKDSLTYLMKHGLNNRARGGSHLELLNTSLVIENPIACMYENVMRSSPFKYIAAELLYYFSGRNDAKFISKFAKMWDSIKNDDGTVNSAYGHLIFTERIPNTKLNQYGWALDALVMDPETRQAVLHFNNSSHQRPNNKDFVCTMYGNFHIRQNKLHFSVFMRSNDVIFGTPTDVAFFCTLHVQTWKHLLYFFPDLELGTYTHTANSFHVYDRHYDLVNNMIETDFKAVELPEIKNNLIFSNGFPTNDVLLLIKELEEPSENDLIFQDQNDLLTWIWGKLQSPSKN